MFTDLNLICLGSGILLGHALSIGIAIIIIRRRAHHRAEQLRDCRFLRF